MSIARIGMKIIPRINEEFNNFGVCSVCDTMSRPIGCILIRIFRPSVRSFVSGFLSREMVEHKSA